MCGFGIATIFQVAIFIIVVLVVIALLKWAFGSWFVGVTAAPYWGLIQIVIGGVIAIMVLLFLWKMAECAGLIGGGRMGWNGNGQIELVLDADGAWKLSIHDLPGHALSSHDPNAG